jgi:CelD/BcsL family acetyltransferase involved in cellulose biosynthesis
LSKGDHSQSSVLLEHLSVDVVTTTEGLGMIKEAWEALFETACDVTVFQSFDWNYAWWENFGHGYGLSIIVVYEKNRLVGLAPFAIRRRLGVPQIEPIGRDQYAYFGLLVENEREDVMEAIAGRLRDLYPVGLVHFPYYDVGNYSVNVLGATLSIAGWREIRWQRNVAQYIHEDNGYQTYINEKSQKARYNLKRERKKLEEHKQMAVVCYRGPEIDQRVIQRMADIQKRSWLWRRGTDPVDSGAFNVSIRQLGRAGMAEVFIMTLDGLDVAFILNFCCARSSHCMAIAFDEALESLSLGKVLMNICVQTLLDQGVTTYDFLFGDGEYKRFWANRTMLIFRSVFYRGLRGWLLSWLPHRLHGKLKKYDALRVLLAKGRRLRRAMFVRNTVT